MESVWIRNGIIVSASRTFIGDVIVAEGKIDQVGQALQPPTTQYIEIDAKGKYILPGAIDPHVHLQLPTPAGPSSDDFYTGTKAALIGGTTTIIDFVTPHRGQSLIEALSLRKKEAEKSLIDYSFHMGISSLSDTTFDEMKQCVEQEGLNSFKAYLAYRETIGVDYLDLERLMQFGHVLNAMICVHCEDGPAITALQKHYLSQGLNTPPYHALSRPPDTESSAVAEVLRLATVTACATYLVHISTAASIDAIEKARDIGAKVYAETCPQYLLLDEQRYQEPLPASLAYIMSPPLRSKEHLDACIRGLTSRNLDVVSTDHCPFNIKGQKDVGLHDFSKVPNGGAGIESRLGLLYARLVTTGLIPIERFVEVVSEAPAKIFGLWPRKGCVAPGADADLIVWDPEYHGVVKAVELAQHCDHATFEGLEVRGKADYVLCKGNIMIAKGEFLDSVSQGKFLKRS